MEGLKKIFWLIVFLISAFLISSFVIEPKVMEIQSKKQNQTTEADEETINLIFTGDIMLNRGVEYAIKQNNDWKLPFLKIAEFLQKADLVFGNLESVISDKGTKVGSLYSFRADPRTIEGLVFASFDVLSLANNHAFDYTSEALIDTIIRLKLADISSVGADMTKEAAFAPLIKEIKDTKIAFLAYTNLGPSSWQAGLNNPGIAWIDENDFPQIQEDIEKAKQESDVLIVSLHAGTEYEPEPDQFQKDFSKMAIDAGANLVIGHHPHVVQPYEEYKNGWIFYSLGNFIFDQDFSEETMKGQIVKVVIKNGKINKVIPINIKINESFQPEIIKS